LDPALGEKPQSGGKRKRNIKIFAGPQSTRVVEAIGFRARVVEFRSVRATDMRGQDEAGDCRLIPDLKRREVQFCFQ
jgi:hypothetical protein